MRPRRAPGTTVCTAVAAAVAIAGSMMPLLLLLQGARASNTGYGEGVVQLVNGTLYCSFDQVYIGDYYWTGVKYADAQIETCMEQCFATVSVDHTPYRISFDPVAVPEPETESAYDSSYDSLVITGQVGEFVCNCPTGSGAANTESLSTTWTMDSMGHVARAWGKFKWQDHIPYSVDTGSDAVVLDTGTTEFGSFQWTVTDLSRYPEKVHLSFTMPRVQFCRGGCNYWDRYQCEADFVSLSGDAFKLAAADSTAAAALAPLAVAWAVAGAVVAAMLRWPTN